MLGQVEIYGWTQLDVRCCARTRRGREPMTRIRIIIKLEMCAGFGFKTHATVEEGANHFDAGRSSIACGAFFLVFLV